MGWVGKMETNFACWSRTQTSSCLSTQEYQLYKAHVLPEPWKMSWGTLQAPLYHLLTTPAVPFSHRPKSPELVNSVPGSDCIDLTDIFHGYVCRCSTRCTSKVGPNPHLLQALCLPKTYEMQVCPQELGNRVAAAWPDALRQGEGLPGTVLAASTINKLCCSSMPHSSSTDSLPNPKSGGQSVGTKRLCRQKSHLHLWRATWKWDIHLYKLVLNF